jgi:hypothetical protein
MQNPFVKWWVVAGGKVLVDEAGRHLSVINAKTLVGG